MNLELKIQNIKLSYLVPEFHKIYRNIDEMTFITVPLPLNTEEKIISMKLSMSSWLSISEKSSILLFINKTYFDQSGTLVKEIEEIFGKNRLIFAGDLHSNSKGIPFVNEWFIQGLKKAQSKYVTFINSDIIISKKWWEDVKKICLHQYFSDKPIIIMTQRLEFKVDHEIIDKFNLSSFRNKPSDLFNFYEQLAYKDEKRKIAPPWAIDIFTFRSDPLPFYPERIPPFLIGRYAWDNWIVGFFHHVCETIFLNNDICVYHVEHQHHSQKSNSPEYQYNLELLKKNLISFGDLRDSKWKLNGTELINNQTKIIL